MRRRHPGRRAWWGDTVVVALIAAALYVGVWLARGSPTVVADPAITLATSALPGYALLSLARMAAAYALSLAFTLVYGRAAARSRQAERFLMPALDVLQSVPILSFLPVVLLSFAAILPEGVAVELASIVLLFTSQAWNLTFAWFQSLTGEPVELQEAATSFRFGGWLRFRVLELSHAAGALVWNSIMSWAGGWFFLMAAESFTVGERDFRLPGLGSYLPSSSSTTTCRRASSSPRPDRLPANWHASCWRAPACETRCSRPLCSCSLAAHRAPPRNHQSTQARNALSGSTERSACRASPS